MNIKFLKKVRKRFDWFFMTEDDKKIPVLIDHKCRKSIVFNEEYIKNSGMNIFSYVLREYSLLGEDCYKKWVRVFNRRKK